MSILVDFISIKDHETNSSYSQYKVVTAGHCDVDGRKKIAIQFSFNFRHVRRFDEFRVKVSNFEDAKLEIDDEDYIQYDYATSSIAFKLERLIVILSNTFDPDSIREVLIGLF